MELSLGLFCVGINGNSTVAIFVRWHLRNLYWLSKNNRGEKDNRKADQN